MLLNEKKNKPFFASYFCFLIFAGFYKKNGCTCCSSGDYQFPYYKLQTVFAEKFAEKKTLNTVPLSLSRKESFTVVQLNSPLIFYILDLC